MSSRTLSAVITLGGSVSSSVRNAFNSVEQSVRRVSDRMRDAQNRQRELNRQIAEQERQQNQANRLSTSERRRMDRLIDQHRLVNRITGERIQTPTTRAGGMAIELTAMRRSRAELQRTLNDATLDPQRQRQASREMEELVRQTQRLRREFLDLRREERERPDRLRRMRTEQERLNRETERLTRIEQNRTRLMERQSVLMGKMIKSAALLTAGVIGSMGAIDKAAKYQFQAIGIGNTIGLSPKEAEAKANQFLFESRGSGLTASEYTAGYGTLTMMGMDSKVAEDALPSLARATTAFRANIEDVAATTFAATSSMKINAKDMKNVWSGIGYGTTLGAYEAKDFAQSMPSQAATMATKGFTGKEAIASLVGASESIRSTVGTAGETRTALDNLLQKLNSNEKIKNLEKNFGIDPNKIWNQALKKGQDPLWSVAMAIQKKTGGKDENLKKIFTDAEDYKGYVGLVKKDDQGKYIYPQIRDKTLKAMKEGTFLDKTFTNEMEAVTNKQKLLTAEVERLAIKVGESLFPAFEKLLSILTPAIAKMTDFVEANKELVGNSILVVGGLLALNTAFLAVRIGLIALRLGFGGLIGGIFRPLLSVVRGVATGFMWFSRVIIGGGIRAGLSILTTGIRILSVGFSGLWGAVVWVGRALALVARFFVANPIVLGAIAIGTAAYLIYEYWGDIVPFFSGLWNDVTTGISSFASACGEALKPVKDVFVTIFTAIADFVAGKMKWIGDQISWIGTKWNETKGYFGMGSEMPLPTPTGKPVTQIGGGANYEPPKTTRDLVERGSGSTLGSYANQNQDPKSYQSIIQSPILTSVNKSPVINGGATLPKVPENKNSFNQVSTTNNTTNNITINQQPNQSGADLGNQVARKIEEQQKNRKNANLFDAVGG